eukprot:scaffold3218_cov99-Isochrysis_galbana.AAC.7
MCRPAQPAARTVCGGGQRWAGLLAAAKDCWLSCWTQNSGPSSGSPPSSASSSSRSTFWSSRAQATGRSRCPGLSLTTGSTGLPPAYLCEWWLSAVCSFAPHADVASSFARRYWLPHPHVHLPHLHMPHLPRLPRRRPRFPSAPSVKVVPADAAAAADAALESRAWRAVVNRGDGAPEASRGGEGGVRGEDGAPAVMDVDDVAEQSRAKGGGGTVVEAGAGG